MHAARTRLTAKILNSLKRDSDLPLRARLRKAVRYVAAATAAPVYLRDCDRVGARARSLGRPVIENQGRIEIGDDFNLNSLYALSQLGTGPEGVIEIGDGVYVNFGVSVTAQRRVKIGNQVKVGPYCVIADVETGEVCSIDGRPLPQPIEIADNVWLGARVSVLPGTSIGEGSVIAAGSIVTGAVPPGVIAGGIPARVLKTISPEVTP